MSYRELIERDPLTGMETWFETAGEGKFSIHYRQDVQPILEANKANALDTSRKTQGIKNSWMHAATIPLVVVQKWLGEGIDIFNPDHSEAIRRKLNDPEYAYLKAIHGRV